MKYFFIEATNSGAYTYLKQKYGHPESSDLSQNPEGWIIEEENIQFISGDFNIYEIPENYQDMINIFKCDFLNADVIIKKIYKNN